MSPFISADVHVYVPAASSCPSAMTRSPDEVISPLGINGVHVYPATDDGPID